MATSFNSGDGPLGSSGKTIVRTYLVIVFCWMLVGSGLLGPSYVEFRVWSVSAACLLLLCLVEMMVLAHRGFRFTFFSGGRCCAILIGWIAMVFYPFQLVEVENWKARNRKADEIASQTADTELRNLLFMPVILRWRLPHGKITDFPNWTTSAESLLEDSTPAYIEEMLGRITLTSLTEEQIPVMIRRTAEFKSLMELEIPALHSDETTANIQQDLDDLGRSVRVVRSPRNGGESTARGEGSKYHRL